MQQKVDRVRRDLEKRGAIEAVRSDIARGKALQFLVDHATVVGENGEQIDLTLPETPNSDDAASDDATPENASTDTATDAERPQV
jgi:hypothetical protein